MLTLKFLNEQSFLMDSRYFNQVIKKGVAMQQKIAVSGSQQEHMSVKGNKRMRQPGQMDDHARSLQI